MNAATNNQRLVQYSPEMESIDALAGALPSTVAHQYSANAETFNEGLVMEFAAELLEATSDRAFAETLERLISRAGQAALRKLGPATAQALQCKLLGLAKNALPFAARALGVPRQAPSSTSPAATAPAAANPIARAAQVFGLELEGLSPEDKEFELTRSFVRLAVDAVRHAASLPDSLPPQTTALRAATEAARHWAPALLRNGAAHRSPFQVPNGERAGVRNFNAVTHRKEPTMHDIDRTQLEYSNEQFEFGESEWSPEGTFSESEQMELASELLSVSNEGEFDRFLGDLVSRATKAVGSFARSSAGQAVGGVLKGVAKKALPLAGTAIGTYFGGPLGAKIGSGIANAASSALGLEGEMAGEDREFEGAKQFVKIAGQTAATAAAAPPGSNPRAVAQQAAMTAAMQHAPGLLAGGAPAPAAGAAPGGATGARSGRWLRRGTKIVLYGV
ncbi:hypothetical protein QTI66_07690 [Variovorax sp. J22R133]|uniref:hypothetical protein n=1 Tax=Variovorax brevis TaxID=3053503 RepID=UPI0025789702|nr:hypothetical protein [Variovorax sp. J22R133]MDM0112026.1 hypothetical protein [Variovorax sp. J22R133]